MEYGYPYILVECLRCGISSRKIIKVSKYKQSTEKCFIHSHSIQTDIIVFVLNDGSVCFRFQIFCAYCQHFGRFCSGYIVGKIFKTLIVVVKCMRLFTV